MRVGLIIYGSLETLSGGYLYDRELVRALRAAGDTVEVIGLPWRRYALRLADNLRRALLRCLADAPFDLLLQDELNHPSLVWLNGRLRRRARYPIVSIVHHLRIQERHPAPLQAVYRRVEAAYLARLDGCIYNSQTTRQGVEQVVGRELPHIVARPSASHRAPRPRAPRAPGDPLRLLFIGNVIPRKGLPTLLEALAMLTNGAWRLEIVGDLTVDRRHSRAMRRRAAAPDLRDRVTWRGRCDDGAVERALAAADLLVVPSQHEGFGIVYLEALAAGTPVIATTGGAAGELVGDGRNGFLVPPDDPGALAAVLRRLAGDLAQLDTLRAGATATAAVFPSWAESMSAVRAWLTTVRRAA